MREKYTNSKRLRRRRRVRRRIRIGNERLRLSVFRSNQRIYAQIINDRVGHTLVSVSEFELDRRGESLTKTQRAEGLGKLLAEKAKKHKISSVVFDRGCYAYHGRVRALADGARAGGLQF